MSGKLFKSLLYKAAQIQHEIEQEHRRPWPDRFRLIKLKKTRLSIKDRLRRLIQSHGELMQLSRRAFEALRVEKARGG